jgi:hypothetical protein
MWRVCKRVGWTVLAAGFAVLAASCSGGPERLPETGATLEGTITYGSEKVMFAQIVVSSPTSTAFGTVGEDGRYKVENCPLGEVTVGVNTEAARGDYVSMTMSQSYKGPDAGKDKSGKKATITGVPKFVNVPNKYHEPSTSGLKTTINKGSNTYDITIPK